MRLNEINDNKGATKPRKRVGRGMASGTGKTSGSGHKGQKARSGGGVRTGFEGGAMPLYMRLPKKGFKNALFKKDFAVVSLGKLNSGFEGEEVSRTSLIEQGFLKGADRRKPLKVLNNGEFSKKLTFVGIEKFSKSAQEAITKAGGEIK